MGLLIVGAGVAVVAIAVVLFLPQTASLFPQPGQVVDTVKADVSGMGLQAQGAAGGVLGNATQVAGGVLGNATQVAGGVLGSAIPAAGPAAAGSGSGGSGSSGGAGSPVAGHAPPLLQPQQPRAAGPGGEASATAKAAVAESSIGSLASLSRQAAGGAGMQPMCIPR